MQVRGFGRVCRALAEAYMSTVLADTLLELIHRDGYGLGETAIIGRYGLQVHMDASKGGERWAVIAPTCYEAAATLMEQLGGDLMDG